VGGLTEQTITTIRAAASQLTGPKRRQFQAQVALDYLGGSPRRAERIFGWGRATVHLGLQELRTGITCLGRFAERGRQRTEEDNPQLAQDIRELVDPQAQVDPKFQSPFLYTRLTAQAVRQALIEHKGYRDADLPGERTFRRLLNRMGYRLRRVQKAKPVKKVKETDAIFANVAHAHQQADGSEDAVRISVDTKAKVQVGELSRDGEARGPEPVKALDHDLKPVATLVPFGILEVVSGWLTVLFGVSRLTSDFVVDCLEHWWRERRSSYPKVKKLVIDLDNGPETSRRRAQFIKRLVEFADKYGLVIELVYYPPYHSKYNPIERCWGILERHWNGALLASVAAVLGWAKTMTWKGEHPQVQLIEQEYERGKRVDKGEMKQYEARLQRSEALPKWSVLITPQAC
jgi:Rhodopirellula transposase DDE domain